MRNFDWALSIKSLSVTDPKSFSGSLIAGASVTVFDGTRSTTLDGTTAFDVSLSPMDAGTRYRFTFSAGTDPSLRTDRTLSLSGQAVTVTLNANASVNMTLGGGAFTGVVVGDTIFIPGPSTGDSTTVFGPANEGVWTVLAVVSATNLQLSRFAGESFSATGEIVTLGSNAQLRAFSSAGVQVGDNVTVSAAFAAATLSTYVVDRVTSTWFEVLSSAVLPAETNKTPTATGMVFYTDGKRFVHLEATQEAVVRFDGSTDDTLRLSPVQAGDRKQPGWVEKFGACHKLVLVNKSAATLDYVAHTAR